MAVNRSSVALAKRLLGNEHAVLLAQNAQKVDSLEEKYEKMLKSCLDSISAWVAEYALVIGEIPKKLPETKIDSILMEMYLQTSQKALEDAGGELGQVTVAKKMAKPKAPASLKEVMAIYDKWRKQGQLPARQKQIRDSIIKQYLKKVRDVWRNHSEDFRSGEIANQQDAVKVFKKAAEGAYGRAKMIVETETTTYYNRTKKDFYDNADAVTHYLFLAIRDQRTSKWCSDKTINGLRGRHGLVYKKGDPLTSKETPAIHWNCRSEMVPLVQSNPRHKQLIEDSAIARRSHRCYPLPKEWNK